MFVSILGGKVRPNAIHVTEEVRILQINVFFYSAKLNGIFGVENSLAVKGLRYISGPLRSVVTVDFCKAFCDMFICFSTSFSFFYIRNGHIDQGRAFCCFFFNDTEVFFKF